MNHEMFDYPSKFVNKFDERSLQIEHISINIGGSSRAVYNYEYW